MKRPPQLGFRKQRVADEITVPKERMNEWNKESTERNKERMKRG